MNRSIADQLLSHAYSGGHTRPARAGALIRNLEERYPRAPSRAALLPIGLLTLFMLWAVINPI